jgi:hypothetical protein
MKTLTGQKGESAELNSARFAALHKSAYIVRKKTDAITCLSRDIWNFRRISKFQNLYVNLFIPRFLAETQMIFCETLGEKHCYKIQINASHRRNLVGLFTLYYILL